MKSLLGEEALLLGDSAVVHEHGGASPPHGFGHLLCDCAGLAEEQALLALGHPGRIVGEQPQLRPMYDQQLAAARRFRWIYNLTRPLRGTLQPDEDRSRIADRGAEANSLQVMA